MPKSTRTAPNKHKPPYRPENTETLDKVKVFLRQEYVWLKKAVAALDKQGKTASAAAKFTEVNAREVWEAHFIQVDDHMLDLYEILGCSREEVVPRLAAKRKVSPIAQLGCPSEGAWLVRSGQANIEPPPGREKRGNPSHPYNVVVSLALNFLHIDEIAEVMGISEVTVRAHMSRMWSKKEFQTAVAKSVILGNFL